MEQTNTAIVVPAPLTPEQQNISTMWGRMGLSVKNSELLFQAQAQAALQQLEIMPVMISDIPDAEKTLKEVKSKRAQLIDDRKAVTGKFDPVIQRLMLPEKSFEVPLQQYEAAIISVKKAHEQAQQKERAKQQELTNIRQNIANALAAHEAKCDNLIIEKVSATLTNALNSSIPVDMIETHLSAITAQVTDEAFSYTRPNPGRAYASVEEVNALINEIFGGFDASLYTRKFTVNLETAFSDYAVSLNNKAEALRISNEQKVAAQQQVQNQQADKAAAATLDTFATPVTTSVSGVKDLKKAYKIGMPETEDNAIQILRAYVSNKALCSAKVSVKKWFNFSAGNAIVALEKVKNDDNNFAPAGITFIEVDKL